MFPFGNYSGQMSKRLSFRPRPQFPRPSRQRHAHISVPGSWSSFPRKREPRNPVKTLGSGSSPRFGRNDEDNFVIRGPSHFLCACRSLSGRGPSTIAQESPLRSNGMVRECCREWGFCRKYPSGSSRLPLTLILSPRGRGDLRRAFMLHPISLHSGRTSLQRRVLARAAQPFACISPVFNRRPVFGGAAPPGFTQRKKAIPT
jgi:hypothetical protein